MGTDSSESSGQAGRQEISNSWRCSDGSEIRHIRDPMDGINRETPRVEQKISFENPCPRRL
jgi:hypothetical protein